jgi:hypothetical protein
MVILPVYVHKINIQHCHWFTLLMETEQGVRQNIDSAKHCIAQGIARYRNGEDQELTELAHGIFTVLYDFIPQLIHSKHKADQHQALEGYLVALGLPKSTDLQYVAGPVLWYAREKRVIPPAQINGARAEPWNLDARLYEEARKTMHEGLVAFGDFMKSSLRSLLAEQR